MADSTVTLDFREPADDAADRGATAADGGAPASAAVGGERRGAGTSRGVLSGVAAVGVLVTALLAWAAWTAHDRNEDRLLEQQTREAAAILSTALPSVQTPLASAAELALATSGDTQAFEEFASRLAGPSAGQSATFDAVALWSTDPGETAPIAVVGDPALADLPGERIRAELGRAVAASQLTIIDLLDLEQPRLGYLFPSGDRPGYVAYAESLLPANRTQQSRQGAAFANLDFAVYFGASPEPEKLVIATTSDLPIRGRTAREPVPFGDGQFLLVATPNGSLGGPLMAALPWIIAIAGLVMTVLAVAAIRRLLQRRQEAEELSRQNALLYDGQRRIAHTLQRSLLPERLPELSGVAAAARHVAGAQGVEIGGDWYDLVALDDGTVVMIVGDVSGRGLPAAATMASLRFSSRAYALEGHPPATILSKLSSLLHIERDGQLATVLCAHIDVRRGEVTLASAGHPGPVLLEGATARIVSVPAGLPVGIQTNATYDVVSFTMASDATLLAFTDGLFERRGETVDVGLDRVRRHVERHGTGPLEELLDRLVDDLLPSSDDDTAILGVRWQTSNR